jgi:hypothetical protein
MGTKTVPAFRRFARRKFKYRNDASNLTGTAGDGCCWHGMSRRAEDCRKKTMECHHRAFACPDPTLRVIYLDLVRQWRQVADEFEAIERHQGRQATDCHD